MVDMTVLQGGYTALQGAKTLVESLIGLRDERKVGEVAVELLGKLFTAYTAMLEAQERIRELEGQIRDFETWAAEKQRYELAELSPRVFAYAAKETMRAAEPVHYLCATCYQQRKTSILQSEGVSWGVEKMRCNTCRSTISVNRPGEGGPIVV